MKKYQAGDSNILAEIIVDYEKKDVKILDPQNRHEIKDSDLNFNFPLIFLPIVLCLVFIFYFTYDIDGAVLSFSMFFSVYLLKVLSPPLSKRLHKLHQEIENDLLEIKKYMVVKDINTTQWTLPYEFKNYKLDWNPKKDFNKFLTKVHIKPKDYYLKRDKKLTRPNDWEAVFYFSEIPKKGEMELTWI